MPNPVKPQTAVLTSFLTFRLARTQNKLNAQASHFLRANSGLSLVEWRIIHLLRAFEGSTMSSLAAGLQIDKGQLSRNIRSMVGKGLIATRQNDKDHRKQDVRLTNTARALGDRLMPLMQQRQEMLVAGVSEPDRETFYKVLEIIEERADRRELP